ncbi:MAG: hypothetical protein SX243_18345 [Acidobacteriota bacterium]|nr:hypothetical protein [Acidobacteriota bacterium]
MLTDIVLALSTAVLSSALTLTVAYLFFQRRWEEEQQKLEQRLEEAIEELGIVIEDRVRRGVLDAIRQIPSAEVLSGTTRTVAQTGADLVGYGLSALLGRKPKDRGEP